MADQRDTPVTQFYSGKTIFLTGSTGCVGKVLLEKILYTTPDIDRIYVLVREKRGKSPAERVEQLIKSPVFSGPNRIAQNLLREKITPMLGDVTMPGLGLSDQDRTIMVNEVNIIFHCAASIKFDDTVKEALKINFLGTKSIADLCHEMKHLEAFVHVSTTYSNSHLTDIEERVYKTQIKGDDLMEMAQWMDSDQLDKMAEEQFYEGRQNSYVFTKALAENYVHEHCQGLPVAIARLPIVLPSLAEPEPGFCDTAGAGNFVMLTTALGASRTMMVEPTAKTDGMPTDLCVNGILLVAREVATSGQDDVQVFNIALGAQFKGTFGLWMSAMNKVMPRILLMKAFRPSVKIGNRTTKVGYLYKKYVLEYVFAILFDMILLVMGKKAFAFKKTKFVSEVRESIHYFQSTPFYFHNEKFRKLYAKQDLADQELFNVNLDNMMDIMSEIDTCTDFFVAGSHSYMKYKLDDPFENTSMAARRKYHRMLYYREMVAVVVIHAILAGLLYLTYQWLTFSWSMVTSALA